MEKSSSRKPYFDLFILIELISHFPNLHFAHYSIQIIKTHNEPTELVQAKDPQPFAEEDHTGCGQPQV